MWMLLIVILSGSGLTSQMIPFADITACEAAKYQVEQRYPGGFNPKAQCVCVDVDQ